MKDIEDVLDDMFSSLVDKEINRERTSEDVSFEEFEAAFTHQPSFECGCDKCQQAITEYYNDYFPDPDYLAQRMEDEREL